MIRLRLLGLWLVGVLGAATVVGLSSAVISVLAMALFDAPWWSGPAFLGGLAVTAAVGGGAIYLIGWASDRLEDS